MYVALTFKLSLDGESKQKLLTLMRWQSSAIRVAYNMLRENKERKEIYERIRKLFPDLPTRYIPSAIIKASQYRKDKAVVFGEKRLFEKLCKKHIQGKQRKRLKQEWRERRQGTLISVGVGNKTEKGNGLLRFTQIDGELYLRITVGNREFMYAKVLRKPSNQKDKWNTFLAMLIESWQNKNYFPYTVELKLRQGEIHGSVAFKMPTPEIWLTKKYGVIGIDTNASPLHLAIAEVSADGNLVSYQRISLHHLIGQSKNKKNYEEWLIAHEVINIAKEKGKAIAIEHLKNFDKGNRGNGKAKLRKRLHNWNFKNLLSKIERLALLNGIEVIKVNPSYTSVIGSLKYAPQLNIDKDVASAFVIGRRALGFEEEVPKNYLKLLSDREYLEYAIYCYQEKEKELEENIKKETNKYKQNAIKSDLNKVQKEKSLLLEILQSLQSEPGLGLEANGRNSNFQYEAWRVLRVAFLFPVLGRFFARGLSPLKPILVQGKWDWVRKRSVPLEAGGTSREGIFAASNSLYP